MATAVMTMNGFQRPYSTHLILRKGSDGRVDGSQFQDVRILVRTLSPFVLYFGILALLLSSIETNVFSSQTRKGLYITNLYELWISLLSNCTYHVTSTRGNHGAARR
jgi:hypothetical protein